MSKIHYPASEVNGTESAPTGKLRIIGTFIDAPSCDILRVRENTMITVDLKSGLIESIEEAPKVEGSKAAGVNNGMMAYVPGFVDCVRNPTLPLDVVSCAFFETYHRLT
jgi:hypothetical protein